MRNLSTDANGKARIRSKDMLKLQQVKSLMVLLYERDGWTQKLKLLEEEETEVSAAETVEVGLKGLESKPQGAM